MAKNNQQDKNKPYYQKFRKEIKNIVESYRRTYNERDLSNGNISLFHFLESGITKHQLRYYQMDALFILDSFYRMYLSEKIKFNTPGYRKPDILKELIVNLEDGHSAPFFGFEMATGSGKTMLMGACVYYLSKHFGINNFLILAPSSLDIYQKTINNFRQKVYESIWADDTPFEFNLITGDDYREQKLFYDDKIPNIFIFNIDKFGKNAKNTEKPFESSVWKDENGNTIGIRDYLKNKRLVIITDEAHHSQGQISMGIIKKFLPSLVLEFTATASESQKDLEKREQTVVYKYDIKQFMEDGYGKLVRAVALASPDEKKKTDDVPQFEKLKLITLFFIHILKKEAMLCDSKIRLLKPLSLIKVKDDTVFSEKIYKYILNDIANDKENIEIIIDKIKSQSLEITGLIKNEILTKKLPDYSVIKKEFESLAVKTIFYHGNSDKETIARFNNIRHNDVEMIVYMQKLDEGIDFPNIYSIAVINDNESDFLTSVKQIIGRGVRLPKEKREFDEEQNLFKTQSEKLHIVCNQGKNFEKVILGIQKEFGLTDKYLSYDNNIEKVINHVKKGILDGKELPRIKADFKIKPNANLYSLISDTDTIINKYLEYNCFSDKENNTDDTKRYIKYMPGSFFMEIDLFADPELYKKEMKNAGAVVDVIKLTEKDTRNIFGFLLKDINILPNTDKYFKEFEKYIKKFNEIELRYYKIDNADFNIALHTFVSSFCFFFRNHFEKNYYELDFSKINQETMGNFILKESFKDYEIMLPTDQIENDLISSKDKDRLIDLIKNSYHFFGYRNCAYDYVKFDSYTEKQLADYLDKSMENNRADFWIKNTRNIYFEYGSKRYFPDYLIFKSGIIYVIETKGEIYSDFRKNFLLSRLNYIEGYKSLIIFSDFFDNYDYETHWSDFIRLAESSYKKRESTEKLITSPPEEEKFNTYLPAYSLEKAFKKFINKSESINPDGWLKIDAPGTHPKSSFVVQIKGKDLEPLYKNNDWIILDSEYSDNEIEGKLSLVKCEEIKDENYIDKYTIRKVTIEVKQSGLFFENRVILNGLNKDTDKIEIKNFDPDYIKIVGIMK